MKTRPKIVDSIFTDNWVDFTVEGGYERYFVSGVVHDCTGDTFYVCHSDAGVGTMRNPYFVPLMLASRLRFVVPQPTAPEPEKLFDKDVPFWFETSPKQRKKL